MARVFYTLALIALMPWAVLHLLWRARRQPEYLRHWGERFGFFAPAPAGPLIWIHAVSVGETRAAQPLVAALKAGYPGHRLLMTHMTPTGRQAGIELFGDGVERLYLPYDTPWGARRFLDHYRPEIGLVMETEIWPNFVAACRRRGTPLLLVNARMSEKSARRYARFPRVTAQALSSLAAISAIGEDDARRLRELGAPQVAVLGNVKFDIDPSAAQLALGREFRNRIGPRPVFLCASTREGEEAAILDAWKPARPAGALLVLVPRHPQRFDEVAALAGARGFRVARRSEGGAPPEDAEVWIGDSLGEMFAYYAAAKDNGVAFVGGSLLPYGSQNLIEACAVGVPVLIGPSTYNFAQAAADALVAGAARQVPDAEELVWAAAELLGDGESGRKMGEAGRAFAERHRGATARTMALVERFIP